MRLLCAVILCAACGGSSAPPDEPDARGPRPPATDLAGYLESMRAEHGVPSLGALVLRGDQTLAVAATGVRKQGDTTPVTVDDRWHLGSDTKAMTATLVALAVDAGTLTWETTLPEAFPDLTIDPGFAAVTVADLLHHRGGAPPSFDLTPWWESSEPITAQRRAFAGQILGRPPAVAPGTFTYSNAGYILVGAILEARAGRAWEDLVRDRLFTPLAMASCGFGPPAAPGAVDQPWGHDRRGPIDPGRIGADNPAMLGPAGTVHCSLADWSRFAAMQLAAARGDTSFVSAASRAQLHTPMAPDGFAMGWVAAQTPAGAGLVHFGSNTMWFVGAALVPSANLAVLVATNSGVTAAEQATNQVLLDLTDAYKPAPLTARPARPRR